jgi:hypothetical protein
MITLARRGQGDLYLHRVLLVVIADHQVQALQQLAQPLGGTTERCPTGRPPITGTMTVSPAIE